MPVPAARENDMHACAFAKPATPPIPHVGGPISVTANRTVKINKMKAATFGDGSECTGVGSPPPKDAIIGGYLKTFIDGNPVAYLGSKTYGGSIVAGSPDTQYQGVVNVLSEAAANWLHQYLAQQKDIPFQHARDGCYARAHEMARIMKDQFDLPVGKKFVYGDLQPATGTNYVLDPATGVAEANGPVTWGYHVAPVVPGVDAAGNPVQYVMDPSLSSGTVLTGDEWVKLSQGSGSVSNVADTPADVYYRAPDGRTFPDPNNTDTNDTNQKYRNDVRKGELTEPDPGLAGKIAPKKSFPKPVVPPPHMP